MRENWREKDESGRKRRQFQAREMLTFSEDVGADPKQSRTFPGILERKIICVCFVLRPGR